MGIKISKLCCCSDDISVTDDVVDMDDIALDVVVDVNENAVKLHPSRMHARSDVLDMAEELAASDTVKVVLPDNVNVDMARAYLSFVEDLTPPPYPDGPKSRTEWDMAERFFGCNVPGYPGTKWLQELYAACPAMGRNASLDWIRRRTVFREEQVADPYMFLMKVEDVTWERADMVELDLDHCCIVKPEKARLVPMALRLTKGCERFKASLRGFPWFAENGKHGAIIAGGRTVALLHNTTFAGQDVDIFVVAPDLPTATPVVERIIHSITTAYKDVLVNASKNTINLVVCEQKDEDTYVSVEKFQIILRVFPSPSHVVHGFDIDLCGILYDGKDTWCTRNAARAMANGFNLLDENKLSSSAVFRYAKYSRMYGYALMAAGIPQAFMATPLARCLTDTVRASDDVDVFSVLKLMRDDKWDPSTAARDYDARTLEAVPNPYTVTYKLVMCKYDVFTGAFNPVMTDTLARYTKYMQ